MRLYVMRHGPAVDRSPTGRDFDRRLTEDGRALVQAMALALRAAHGAPLPRVISSPRVRARETATIVVETMRLAHPTGEVEIDEELDGEQPIPSELVSALASAGADALLVGHQPSVEDLCRSLVQPEPLPTLSFRAATIVVLERTDARFRVDSILDPRKVCP